MADKAELEKLKLQYALLTALQGASKGNPLSLATFTYLYNAKEGTAFLIEDAEELVDVLRDQGYLVICRLNNGVTGHWITESYADWVAYRDEYLTPQIARQLGRLRAMSETAAKYKPHFVGEEDERD